jgi:hypothetical protein
MKMLYAGRLETSVRKNCRADKKNHPEENGCGEKTTGNPQVAEFVAVKHA